MITHYQAFVNTEFQKIGQPKNRHSKKDGALAKISPIKLSLQLMSQFTKKDKNHKTSPAPPSLWKSIILIIIFVFGIVSLFGLILYLLVDGAQRLGLSTTGYIAIFVVVSGIFAWLVKRISDTASSMSHYWFSEESEDKD